MSETEHSNAWYVRNRIIGCVILAAAAFFFPRGGILVGTVCGVFGVLSALMGGDFVGALFLVAVIALVSAMIGAPGMLG